MQNYLEKNSAGCVLALVCLAGLAVAQPPAPGAPAAPDATVVAHPTYISIPLEITVDRPAAEVWKRVGKYCDIGEWLQVPCTIVSGKDGEVGVVRSIGTEVMVGKTELSYTYTQPREPAVPTISITARWRRDRSPPPPPSCSIPLCTTTPCWPMTPPAKGISRKRRCSSRGRWRT